MKLIPKFELLIRIAILLKIVSYPLSNKDVATNNYLDTNVFTTAGGVCVW